MVQIEIIYRQKLRLDKLNKINGKVSWLEHVLHSQGILILTLLDKISFI